MMSKVKYMRSILLADSSLNNVSRQSSSVSWKPTSHTSLTSHINAQSLRMKAEMWCDDGMMRVCDEVVIAV